MSPEEFDALFDKPLRAAQPGPATQPAAPAPIDPNDPFADPTAPPPEPSLGSRIVADIGTGITEIPRAVVGGVRDAIQETGNSVTDGVNWAAGTDYKLPQLPAIDRPNSVTGGLAHGVSQFVTGMIGLGKITKPLEVATGVAKAGVAVRAGLNTAKAATVGAFAFDPYGPRLSDLVESVPGLSNPVSRYLQSSITDTAAEGRLKNAIESLGMDAALMSGFVIATRLYRTMRDFRAGKATQADVDHAIAEAQTHEAQQAQQPATTEAPAPNATPDAQPPAVKRDVLDITSPSDTFVTARPGAIEVSPAQTQSLLKSMEEDAAALSRSGSWDAAVMGGHTFGKGERVPWQKLALEDGPDGDGLAALIARLSDSIQPDLNNVRGGDADGVADGVLRDAKVREMVEQRRLLWGDDPSTLAGVLSGAGENARSMAVNMQTSYVVAQRALQDTFTLAARIKAGDFAQFGGSPEAAAEGLQQMLAVSSTLYGYAQSMRASAGRTMRLLRSEHAPSPETLAAWKSLEPAALVDAIMATGGDPRSLIKLASPSVMERLRDAAQFQFVNALLWSPKTHAVNFVSNMYMATMRPMERMIGAAILDGGGTSSAAFRESIRQYAYIGSSLTNSWREAKEAWIRGDSVLAPHATDTAQVGINAARFEPKGWDSVGNILHSALVVPAVKVTGFPVRMLGAADELVKQVVYRSKVQARAHVEAMDLKLEGEELTQFVRDRLHSAFDERMAATDLVAKHEAQVATFSQDLLPGTLGKTVQDGLARHPMGRFVIPFLRTPMNVMRYGIKLTPLLNLRQAEYRQMIKGEMGREMQAQAVGQMALGTLFMGTATYLAASGAITGGAPTDPKIKAALLATGWQPYSFVAEHADGTRTYTNYGRFDPVTMPFGIAADIVNAWNHSDGEDGLSHRIADASLAALMGVAKQLADKSYLKSVNDVIEAVMEPERKGEKAAGSMAANFIPASSLLRFVNPDPHLREARGFTDKLLATIPGLSATLPAKRDMWGDPITVNKGLWVTGDRDIVDAEMRRMMEDSDEAMGPPNPSIDGVDLRDITLKNGKNAYDEYQTLAAMPGPGAPNLKDIVANLMKSPAYVRAPDGDIGTRGTKLWIIAGPIARYRDAALRQIKADPEVMKALSEKPNAVRQHYEALRAKTAAESSLGQLGAAFGVDLGQRR